jgi:hypothetical protein
MSIHTHDQKRPTCGLKELSQDNANTLGHLMFATALTAQQTCASKVLRVPRALAAVIRTIIQDNYPACPRAMRGEVIRGAAYAASLHAFEDAQLAQEMGRASVLLDRVPWAYLEQLPELLVFDGLEGEPQKHSFLMRIVPHGDPIINESLGRITRCPKHFELLLADLRAA